jgi:hypothetical protein
VQAGSHALEDNDVQMHESKSKTGHQFERVIEE